MRQKVLVIRCLFIALAATFFLYFAFGLRAIGQGCRGFSADCYIPAAQFSKDMQALTVMMLLGIAVFLFAYLLFYLFSMTLRRDFKK